MDPLQRREPPASQHERCTADTLCDYPNELNRLMQAQQTQDTLDRNLKESTEALKRCVKKLLLHGDTNDLAHQLISSSLSFVEPRELNQEMHLAAATAATTATSSDMAAHGRQVSLSMGANETLIDLSTLNGIMPNKIGGNLSLARLDLIKLNAHLPAEENSFRLEALDEEWQLYLRTLYSVTAIISILLNLITVIVLYRAKPSELRKYLINLAIGDLFMSCFSIPFTYTEYMLGYWDYPPILCPVVKFVVTLSVYVSVCTMVVIGVNRHVAILYPLKKCSERAWKCSKNAVICAIWLSGIIISSPEFLMFKSTQFCYNQRYLHDCRNMWGDPFSYYYTIFIFMTTFVIPFVLLCYLYSSIGIQLKHREMPGNADASRDLTMQTKRAKVVKMLIVVVVVFGIFWLPLQTFTLIMFIFPHIRQVDFDSASYNLFVGTYFTFHWMSMAHSCLNPLIYCFMNPKFRKDLRDLICGLRWAGGGGGGGTSGGGGATGGGGGTIHTFSGRTTSQLFRSQRCHHFDRRSSAASTMRTASTGQQQQHQWPPSNQQPQQPLTKGSLKLVPLNGDKPCELAAAAVDESATRVASPLLDRDHDNHWPKSAGTCHRGANERLAAATAKQNGLVDGTIREPPSGNNVSQAALNGLVGGPEAPFVPSAKLASSSLVAAHANNGRESTGGGGGGASTKRHFERRLARERHDKPALSKSIEIATLLEVNVEQEQEQDDETGTQSLLGANQQREAESAAAEIRRQTQLVVEGRPGGSQCGVTMALCGDGGGGQHQTSPPRRPRRAASADSTTSKRPATKLVLVYRNKMSQLTRLVSGASCSSTPPCVSPQNGPGIANV